VSPWLRLWRLVAPYRLRLVLAGAFAATACLLSLASPLLIERLIRHADNGESLRMFAAPIAMLLAAVLLYASATCINSLLLGRVGLEVVRDLRSLLYSRLQKLPIAWFDRTPTGAVISRVMDDVAVVQGLVSGQTMAILIDVGTAAGVMVWIGLHSWRLLAVVLVLLPTYGFFFRLFTSRIHAGTLDVRRGLDQVFSHLKQKIDGVQVVRATAGESTEVAAFTRQLAELHQPRLHVSRLGVAFSNLCVGLGGFGATLVFAVGAWEASQGRLTAGEVIAASALAGLLFAPIVRLSELATLFEHASASLSRLSEILDAPAVPAAGNTDQPSTHTSKLMECSGLIEFDAVDFDYQAGQPVLRDVSLRIEPGTRVAVVGPTGSGKSTLMNLLLRFYGPTRGEIRLGSRPLSGIPTAELRNQLGLVPQDAIVFRDSLATNIGYGSPNATNAEILAAAQAAAVEEFAAALPRQYQTLVGEGGYPLSQGQRQRIAIARVFCKNPAVVILDEATSSLDRASERLVEQALDRLLAGRTTFIIAHRLATVVNADLIVVLNQGRIVQTGTHAELLADKGGLYRRLYDSQFGDVHQPPLGNPGRDRDIGRPVGRPARIPEPVPA
jgi:subfamily B ATP-binding cassette protein MsbA